MNHLARFFLTLCIGIVLLLLIHPPLVQAMEFRSSDQTVTVGPGETIVGSLFATGQTVQIDGVVEGDVYCAGKTILVKGSIGGDVICAGQMVEVDGTVAGSVRVAGQTVVLNGYIGRNVTGLGQTISVGSASTVNGDVISAGQTITLGGVVRQGLAAAGDTVLVNGTIGGDTNFAVNRLQLGETAKISGKLTYESEKDAVIATGASVGTIVKQPMRKNRESWQNPREKLPKLLGAMRKPWPVNALGSIVTFFLLAVVLVFLFPQRTQRVVTIMKMHPGRSIVMGLLALVVSPVIFVTLLITIIGIPLAILYILLFALVVFVSKLFVALWVGKEIQATFMKKKGENWYLAAAIGVIISWLVFYLPYAGGIISCIALIIGVGGVTSSIFSKETLKKGSRR
jgi:cytoskeletal protein CcmA (bactofilin family)